MRVRRMGSVRFIAYGITPGQGRAGPKAGGKKLGRAEGRSRGPGQKNYCDDVIIFKVSCKTFWRRERERKVTSGVHLFGMQLIKD